MALEFGMPIKAAAVNKYLTDASYIKGGYCVVANATERDELPVATATQDGIVIVGSLVYCVQEQAMYICTAITLVDNTPTATWTPYVSGGTVDPMIFMGTLGSTGSIQSLPDTSASNKGFTYKVITDGTYTYNTSMSVTVKIGDTLISDSTEWVVIPSGDEPTYQSLSESQNSSEVSLVTRGEKYTWNHSFLPLSGGNMSGTLNIATGLGISDVSGNGMLAYHPSNWTAVSSTGWGLGAVDSQGVIRSSNSDLVHYKHNVGTYTILDSSNCSSYCLTSVPAASQTTRGGAKIYASGDVVYITTT